MICTGSLAGGDSTSPPRGGNSGPLSTSGVVVVATAAVSSAPGLAPCDPGFAVRGKELVVYLVAGRPEQVRLLAKLGRHKIGKSCLYFKRLADLDVNVLEALIAGSVADVRRRHPHPRDA